MSSFKKFSPTTTSSLDKGNSQQSTNKSLPSGCKFSTSNMPVTSSGIPSLDSLMADGIPIGTIVGICEDSPTNYSQIISKLYLSQGLHSEQVIFVVCIPSSTVKLFVSELPGLQDQSSSTGQAESAAEGRLNIAWRYQNLAQLESKSLESNFCYSFDLTKTVDFTNNPNVHVCTENSLPIILEAIKTLIKRQFDARPSLSTNSKRQLLRILLPSLGSLAWNATNEQEICNFIFQLKSLLRYSYAVCYITFPNWIYSTFKIFPFVDCCITMDTGAIPTESNIDFHGFLRFDKCFRINSFAPNAPLDTRNFVFKCKKHKFLIEKFHLPPELGEEPSRFTTACSSSKTDF